MKIFEERTLRLYIRQILEEMGGPAMASGSDPTDVKGFYPYDVKGVDIHSYWYRSPGRGMGSDGDFRPADPLAYIGMKLSAAADSAESKGGDQAASAEAASPIKAD